MAALKPISSLIVLACLFLFVATKIGAQPTIPFINTNGGEDVKQPYVGFNFPTVVQSEQDEDLCGLLCHEQCENFKVGKTSIVFNKKGCSYECKDCCRKDKVCVDVQDALAEQMCRKTLVNRLVFIMEKGTMSDYASFIGLCRQ